MDTSSISINERYFAILNNDDGSFLGRVEVNIHTNQLNIPPDKLLARALQQIKADAEASFAKAN